MEADWTTRRVERAKVEGYLLDRAHPKGRSKAAYFERFGFRATQPMDLVEALLDHPVRNPVSRTVQTPHGMKFEIQCTLVCPDGRTPCIVSVWLAALDKPVRLITAYPAG